ncbi:hypothetical protein MXB_1807, partial [Myxobolus squamalis]
AVSIVTDVGNIKIELFCAECPNTCYNFLSLCASNYYDGCLFHRNIKGFMVQTGDPTGIYKFIYPGTGKNGKSIWGTKFNDELDPSLKHSCRGIVSMANNGPNTNASQFFITFSKQQHLDLKYTVFGKVIDGFDALEELERLPTDPKNYRPFNSTYIQSVIIHSNPLAEG